MHVTTFTSLQAYFFAGKWGGGVQDPPSSGATPRLVLGRHSRPCQGSHPGIPPAESTELSIWPGFYLFKGLGVKFIEE